MKQIQFDGGVGCQIYGWSGMKRISKWRILAFYYMTIIDVPFLIHKWGLGKFENDETIFMLGFLHRKFFYGFHCVSIWRMGHMLLSWGETLTFVFILTFGIWWGSHCSPFVKWLVCALWLVILFSLKGIDWGCWFVFEELWIQGDGCLWGDCFLEHMEHVTWK